MIEKIMLCGVTPAGDATAPDACAAGVRVTLAGTAEATFRHATRKMPPTAHPPGATR